MENLTVSRQNAIREKQTTLLYEGLKFSAATSIFTALAVAYTIGPWSNQTNAWLWFIGITTIYIARLYDSQLFHKTNLTLKKSLHWNIRYKAGAYSTSIAWASCIWFVFPSEQPVYQAIIVFIMGGVVGAALATQPYDKKVLAIFQGLIATSVEIRLIIEGQLFSLELAALSLLIFGILILGGRQIAINYLDLLYLRQESEDSNLAVIKTTEEMAQIGYWKWDMHSRKIEVSQNLANMWGFPEIYIDLSHCINLIHKDDRQRVIRAIDATPVNGDEFAVEYRMLHPKTGLYLNMNQVSRRMSDAHGVDYVLGTVQDISTLKSIPWLTMTNSLPWLTEAISMST